MLCASPWSWVHHSWIVGSHPPSWNQILQSLSLNLVWDDYGCFLDLTVYLFSHKSMFEFNQISVTSICRRKYLPAGTDPYWQPVLLLDFWTRSLLSFTGNLQTCRCVSFSLSFRCVSNWVRGDSWELIKWNSWNSWYWSRTTTAAVTLIWVWDGTPAGRFTGKHGARVVHRYIIIQPDHCPRAIAVK